MATCVHMLCIGCPFSQPAWRIRDDRELRSFYDQTCGNYTNCQCHVIPRDSTEPSSTGSAATTAPIPRSRKGPTLYDMLDPAQPQNLTNKATMAFVMNSISHHIIENPGFVDFCMAVVATKGNISMPSRKTLRNNIIQQGKEQKKVQVHVLARSSFL